jgi:exosortase D (VPLPA-CTERM-specific)
MAITTDEFGAATAPAVSSWRHSPAMMAGLAVLAGLVLFTFYDAMALMVNWWSSREEYSHGFLIPVVSAYLIWQHQTEIRAMPFTGSWLGVAVFAFGMLMGIVGELSSIYTVIQYGAITALLGLTLAYTGPAVFRIIAVPMFMLYFMVPLPNFLYNTLSSQLQLLSSEIGVWFIRLFGISVFLEGNVIDLGSYKLQVVEACNGLRYLFPLMALGFIVAYLYQASLWKRAFIFVSTVPITILMNSFRIGVIGYLVDNFGQSQAEGFLHDFEGWVIFMACFGILFLEMWLLEKLFGQGRPLRSIFGLEPPMPEPAGAVVRSRGVPRSVWVALVILVPALLAARMLPDREELTPPRQSFAGWPLSFEGWQGRTDTMESQYIQALKFDDYVMAYYERPGQKAPLHFYVAWYASQRKGQSAHSPRSCIPGGGWRIESLTERKLDGVQVQGQPLTVNRVLIRKGEYSQLVYYWFQGRDRVLTNEYAVKWYIFLDSLTRQRSDGALVRLTTVIDSKTDIARADELLTEFAADMTGRLDAYVP